MCTRWELNSRNWPHNGWTLYLAVSEHHTSQWLNTVLHNGWTRYLTMVEHCTLQWLNTVPHNGWTLYLTMVEPILRIKKTRKGNAVNKSVAYQQVSPTNHSIPPYKHSSYPSYIEKHCKKAPVGIPTTFGSSLQLREEKRKEGRSPSITYFGGVFCRGWSGNKSSVLASTADVMVLS